MKRKREKKQESHAAIIIVRTPLGELVISWYTPGARGNSVPLFGSTREFFALIFHSVWRGAFWWCVEKKERTESRSAERSSLYPRKAPLLTLGNFEKNLSKKKKKTRKLNGKIVGRQRGVWTAFVTVRLVVSCCTRPSVRPKSAGSPSWKHSVVVDVVVIWPTFPSSLLSSNTVFLFPSFLVKPLLSNCQATLTASCSRQGKSRSSQEAANEHSVAFHDCCACCTRKPQVSGEPSF